MGTMSISPHKSWKPNMCVSILQNPGQSSKKPFWKLKRSINDMLRWIMPPGLIMINSCRSRETVQYTPPKGLQIPNMWDVCVWHFVLWVTPSCPSVCNVRNTEVTFSVSVSHCPAKILETAWCDVIWFQLCGTVKLLPERPVRISAGAESRAQTTSGRITLCIAQSGLLRNCILQAMCCSHHTDRGYTPPPHAPDEEQK